MFALHGEGREAHPISAAWGAEDSGREALDHDVVQPP
jgi:hypothetical protein